MGSILKAPNGMEAKFTMFVILLTMLLSDQSTPYSVDQPPPAPVLSPDDPIATSRRDEGFHLILGTLLSFNSDTAFPRFIGPSSNPLLAKDPRSLSEARLLGVLNWAPTDHPWDGNLAESYLLQVRVAIDKRWSVFMDKSGYSFINQGANGSVDGWNNLAFGGKYVLIRDVENQFLLSAGLQYEAPTGESSVYQRPSDGSLTAFVSAGQEFWCFWHAIGNVGARIPMSDKTSGLFYGQVHLDRECMGWLYPLVECNYYRITSDGNGTPAINLGQGDALLDWSMPGTVGSDLVTVAVGMKAKCNRNLEVGITYERPLTDTSRVLEHRIVAELILRY